MGDPSEGMDMMNKVAISIVVILLMIPGTALAVWGGPPDGDGHPSVGAIYFDGDGDGEVVVDDLVCSGSYIGRSVNGSHDVFLTAGHCLPPPEDEVPADLVMISFDNNDQDMAADTPISVTGWHQMPGFGHDRSNLRDLGVFLVPAGSVAAAFPAAAAEPVQLPPLNYLDTLKAGGELMFRTIDIVGYGAHPIWGGPTRFEVDGIRRAGTTTVNGLTKAYVRANQNPRGIGTGSGVCFGDSGSPNFERNSVMAISVTGGGNRHCNAYNYNQRVDTPEARAFLGAFVELP